MLFRKNKIRKKISDWLNHHPECLHYLLEEFGVFQRPYIRGGEDANRETHVELGRQDAGLTILEIAQMTPREVIGLRERELLAQAQEEQEMADDG